MILEEEKQVKESLGKEEIGLVTEEVDDVVLLIGHIAESQSK